MAPVPFTGGQQALSGGIPQQALGAAQAGLVGDASPALARRRQQRQLASGLPQPLGIPQAQQPVIGPSASGVLDGQRLADPIGTFAGGTNAQGFTPGRAAFEAIRQGGGLEALQGGAANAQGFTPLRAIMERLRAGGAFG
jgi:hypothetical protein